MKDKYLDIEEVRRSSGSMEEDESFNGGLILPPLLVHLRKILDQYPDDSQILKELIQNAEDANAREIKFMYDKQTYGRDPRLLHHQNLTKYQGPALYAYNDGVFSDDDWRGIRMLSQSVKLDDPLKVGYFGMGFKSVFHLTDMPFILSGDRLAAIDPQESCFQSSSFAWSLARQGDMVSRLTHQVAPFLGKFNVTEDCFNDGYYNGTLFRFPLRTYATRLSDTIYSPERMHRLLESFKEDAHSVMIFLMHLENIEFYEKTERSNTPKLTFCLRLSERCLYDVRQRRTEFMNQIKSGKWPDKALVVTYPIEIETIDFVENEERLKTDTYLVTNYFSGSQVSSVFKKLYQDSDLRFPPWVGTALPLHGGDKPQQNGDSDSVDDPKAEGHVFCFLPLPMEGNTATGLPVHVNGFFALEQNRKYIKMPGMFQTREDLMDKRLLWNQCMMKEALPRAYVHLILSAIQLHTMDDSYVSLSIDDIYRAFPNYKKVDRQWDTILPFMYGDLFQRKVIHAASNGGHWVEPRNAVFNTLDKDEEASPVIIEILTVGGVNIAEVPSHVLTSVQNYSRLLNGKITPNLVAQTYSKVQHNMSPSREDREKLLKYLLKNFKYDLLDGLELLPLASGGYTCFTLNPRRSERLIYIPSDNIPMDLLPGLEDEFLCADIDREAKDMLIRAVNRGYTQLKVLDPKTFAALLPRCLPADWVDQKKVLWRPDQHGQPPSTWLEALWTYLVRCCPSDISAFETIPLIPLHGLEGKDIDLVPLTAAGPLLARTLNEQSLPNGIQSLLETLGVVIVDSVPDYIAIHPAVVRRYVHSPTYIGVLHAMGTIVQGKGLSYLSDKVLESTSSDEKRKLREFFNKVSQYELTDDITGVLACLPIFEAVKLPDAPIRFVAFDRVNFAAPVEKLPVVLSQDVLDLMRPHTSNLSRVLGVRILSMADLLMEVVFLDIEAAFYEIKDVEKLMIFVLRHYFTFLEQNPSFQEALQSLSFMPRKEVLLTADRFYDPDDQLLQRMFLGEENFPFGVYSDPTIVTVLRQIGLRGVHEVEPEDLRESCYQTEDMAQGRRDMQSDRVAMKSDAIMDYLDKHPIIMDMACDKSTLKECICDIGWVRQLTRKPAVYPNSLPWFKSDVAYHKPKDMVHKIHSNVVGSVLPVVAKDTGKIGNKFGWLNPPGAEHLVQHLANAVTSFKGIDKAMYLEITRAVYNLLTDYSTEDVQELLDINKLTDWLWHGDGFTSPQTIVFREPFMDLRPFVYTFPAELQPLAEFFAAFGAQENCHLPNVLKQVKTKNDAAEVLHTSATEVKKDLHLCVTILNELKSSVTEDTLPSLQDELVLPVHTDSNMYLKMAPLHDCTYCDHEWMRQGYDLGSFGDEEENLQLVHPNLPIVTSQQLGVPTLMSRMLEAEELDFSFGQTDSLTHRLNVLLQEYVDGFAVPKELVQNADDAGATCVKFLYDERQNQDCRTCLIDEGMRECQGPALWAYNNAVFSDEDFENITKLSGATKEDKADKIGRFGLGFNAVYNLTDVPSFISRHNIVIFDPHTTHLGKSIKNKSKPGIKIDMQKHRRKLRRLTNQFKPYNDVFGCDLRPESTQSVYNGTLFRLPLRTTGQAVKSEICQRHYDDSEVKALLTLLIQGAENLLLFTQNIVEISIYHLPAHGRTPSDANQVFTIHKRSLRILKELVPVVPPHKLASGLPADKIAAVKQSGTLKAASKVLSDIRSGVDPKQIVLPNAATVLSLEQKITDAGSKLLRVKYFQKTRPWLVACFMGYGESLQMSVTENTLIPIAGVAVPLEDHEATDCYMPVPIMDSDKSPCGTVFTYLPLPIHTGLPIHINGAFAIASNRRHLLELSDEDKYDPRAVWNEVLLKDAVCNAYISALKHLAAITPQTDYQFHMLWPDPKHVETSCQSLVTHFYKMLADESEKAPALFSDGLKWVNIQNTCSLGGSLKQPAVIQDALVVFRICCDDLPSIVTDIPEFVREGFKLAGRTEMIMRNSHDMRKFFKEVFLPNIELTPPVSRDKLMIHALTSDLEDDSELSEAIKTCPCIPTSPDGLQLKSPEELVDPESPLAKLYSPVDARFPHTSYRSPEVLRPLRNLGMATSEITWLELLHRAESVAQLNHELARKKKKVPTATLR